MLVSRTSRNRTDTTKRSQRLAQNLIRNPRLAERIVRLASNETRRLCIDLGAGKGPIAGAALQLRQGPVRVLEIDERMVGGLRRRFERESRVEIIAGNLLDVPLPAVPFVIASNPPFNVITKLIRRWVVADKFTSGAIVVERSFGRRISGGYGATKLSLSLAPFFQVEGLVRVDNADFTPRPRQSLAIMPIRRRTDTQLSWADREAYWQFVGFLFERSRYSVGEAIQPLQLLNTPRRLAELPLKELTVSEALALFDESREAGGGTRALIRDFDRRLPEQRRAVASPEPE